MTLKNKILKAFPRVCGGDPDYKKQNPLETDLSPRVRG